MQQPKLALFIASFAQEEQQQNSYHALRMGWHSLFLVAHAPDVLP